MGACREKARTACEWHSQLDDSIGNTPTTVSWWVWGYEVGLGWRLASSGIYLPNNVFSWLLSDFTGPFSRPKNPSKTCAPQGASPVCVAACGQPYESHVTLTMILADGTVKIMPWPCSQRLIWADSLLAFLEETRVGVSGRQRHCMYAILLNKKNLKSSLRLTQEAAGVIWRLLTTSLLLRLAGGTDSSTSCFLLLARLVGCLATSKTNGFATLVLPQQLLILTLLIGTNERIRKDSNPKKDLSVF